VTKPLVVPAYLHDRNAPRIRAEGIEHTGSVLIARAIECIGLNDLRNTDVLDIGCGVRFAQTIINRDIPIKSYTGVDVDRNAIEFLQTEVDDDRFTFAHWDVRNPRSNPNDVHRLSRSTLLPVVGTFDAIWMFSVVTHLDPHDTDALLAILRRAIRPHGALLFSTFLDTEIDTYREDNPDRPSAKTLYNEHFLRELVSRNQWEVQAKYPRGSCLYIVDHFVCRPIP
jgi:SAM-dependent methyltransferase